MEKPEKISKKGLILSIFGLIIVLIIIGGIDAITEEAPSSDQPAGQVGEIDQIEHKAQIEEPASDQNDNQASSPKDKNLTVHFLDAGQGDSVLLEYNGKVMLVDAGEQDQGQKVSEYLHDYGISSLDYVVATHPHSDHIGGMEEILKSFPVKHFIDSGFPHTSKTYENMLIVIDEKNIPFKVVKKGEKIEFDPALEIEVLNPETQYSEELNENSIVLKIDYGEVSFLFMGDAGLETEEKLLDADYDLDSDILKVGHHASISGSGDAFISTVSPEVSVIEVGAGNSYGHPHDEVLQRLESSSRVYRTDLDGTIVITTDGSIYTINTGKAAEKSEKMKQRDQRIETVPEEGTTLSTNSINSEEKGTGLGGNLSSSPSSSTGSTVYVSELELQDEWVKLSNDGSSSIPLKGWRIEDDGSKHTFTFPAYTLEPETTVTLYTGKGTNSATEIYWGSGNPIWNNDGDKAYLYNSDGELVSTLEG